MKTIKSFGITDEATMGTDIVGLDTFAAELKAKLIA